MAQTTKRPMLILIALALVIFEAVRLACRSGPEAMAVVRSVSDGAGVGTFTDARDGKTYKALAIGDMVWMAENLNYLPNGGGCYNDDESYCDKYGALYDWNAAKTACPARWRLPTRGEWNRLCRAVGGNWELDTTHTEYFARWGVAGAKLKAKSGWDYYRGESGGGGDDYGFSALPGGAHTDGNFNSAGEIGNWWTSERADDNSSYVRRISYKSDRVFETVFFNHVRFSVRCVAEAPVGKKVWEGYKQRRDEEITRAAEAEKASAERRRREIEKNSAYFTDSRDGQRYRAVEIRGRAWMAENLRYLPPDGKSWCYGDDSANCDKYGRLYGWVEAKAACPNGWHLPSVEEWDSLSVASGGDSAAGKALKSAEGGWKNGGNGTDAYGFSALPGGMRYSYNGFIRLDAYGNWWTSTAYNAESAHVRMLSYNADKMFIGYAWDVGLSVRCVGNAK